MKVSAGTITRTIILVLTLANTVLTAAGKNPLPFSEEQAYELISVIAAAIASLVAWWKNNSFTKAAIEADEIMKEKKALETGYIFDTEE